MKALAIGLLLASAGAAHAQTVAITPDFDVDPFVVTSDPGSVALTDSATPLAARTLAVGLALRLGGPPLHLCMQDASGDCTIEGDVVSTRFSSDLTAAYGFGRVEVHGQLPIVLHQGSDFAPPDGEPGLGSGGVGDLRLGSKVRVLSAGPFTLGGDLTLGLPTGGGDDFIGDPGVSVDARVLAGWRRGKLATAAGLGYVWRSHEGVLEGLRVDDEVVWSLAGEYALRDELSAGLALFGRVGVLDTDAEELPFEVLASGRYWLTDAIALEAAVGSGIGDGYGAPSFRTIVGARWMHRLAKRPAPLVTKPEPEPEPDPEPTPIDPDPDQDGILDPADVCPTDAEDVDQLADDDGCPESDADEDRVLDEADHCPTDPEDLDTLVDDDGCPETDADADGFTDDVDQCPSEAEVFNDRFDDDGCPDEGRPLATVTSTGIEITDKIFFDLDKATIKKKSHPVLDAVASLLKSYDTLIVEIQGHTDDTGLASWNMTLSQQRADAVRAYLIKKGIAADRLTAVGYGSARPLIDEQTDKARSKNRRVEFVIVDNTAATTSPPAR